MKYRYILGSPCQNSPDLKKWGIYDVENGQCVEFLTKGVQMLDSDLKPIGVFCTDATDVHQRKALKEMIEGVYRKSHVRSFTEELRAARKSVARAITQFNDILAKIDAYDPNKLIGI